VTLFIGEKLLEERNADWITISCKIARASAQTVEEAFSIAQNLGLRLD
jgi:3-keto-L-gulonate-6-phosphate decarboxylase